MSGYTYWYAEDASHRLYALVSKTPDDLHIPTDAPEGISGPLPNARHLRTDWPHRHGHIYTPIHTRTDLTTTSLTLVPGTAVQVPSYSENHPNGKPGRSYAPIYEENQP